MAEPSNSVFEVPHSLNADAGCEQWNTLVPTSLPNSHSDQLSNETSFNYGTPGQYFGGSLCGWSSVDNSRPISTPSPTTSATGLGLRQMGDGGLCSDGNFGYQHALDAAGRASLPYHTALNLTTPSLFQRNDAQYLRSLLMQPQVGQDERVSMGQYLMPVRSISTIPGEQSALVQPDRPETSHLFTCFACGHGYANETFYHSHWLRVHVLQTKQTNDAAWEQRKRKRVDHEQQRSTDDSYGVYGEQQASPTAPWTTSNQSNCCMDNCTSVQLMHGQLQTSPTATTAALLHPQLQPAEFYPILDLSTKSNIGQQYDSGYQSSQVNSSSVVLAGQSVETRRKVRADCLTIRSADLAMSFILPRGVLPGHPSMPLFPPTPMDTPSLARETVTGDSAELSLNVYRCPECPRAYRSRSSLRKHKKSCHFQVETGQAKTTVRSVFENVEAMEQLPHGCASCPKRFATEKLLKQHASFHRRADGEKEKESE